MSTAPGGDAEPGCAGVYFTAERLCVKEITAENAQHLAKDNSCRFRKLSGSQTRKTKEPTRPRITAHLLDTRHRPWLRAARGKRVSCLQGKQCKWQWCSLSSHGGTCYTDCKERTVNPPRLPHTHPYTQQWVLQDRRERQTLSEEGKLRHRGASRPVLRGC